MRPVLSDVVRSGPGSRGPCSVKTRALAPPPASRVFPVCLARQASAENRQPRAQVQVPTPAACARSPGDAAPRIVAGGGLLGPGDVSTTIIYSHVLNRAVAA